MVAWAHKYGTLGHGKPQWDPGAPQGARWFRAAVHQAAQVLALFEAVLDGDVDRARLVLLYDSPLVAKWQHTVELLPPENRRSKTREWIAAKIGEETKDFYEGDYLCHALDTAAEEVEGMVAALCFPALYVPDGARDPKAVSARWSYGSLLGAMYMQMYRLMAAGSDLRRCRYCGRLISLARPHPTGRKPREDKEFCNDACRQAHHRSRGAKTGTPGEGRSAMGSKETREFILVAEDCPVEKGTVPYSKRGSKTVPMHTFEVLSEHPYLYTEDELQHEVHVVRRGLPRFDPAKRDLKRNELPKWWGWGLHFDEDRKIALVGCETEEYERLSRRAQERGTAVRALRSRR
jgi:hypothetical protein